MAQMIRLASVGPVLAITCITARPSVVVTDEVVVVTWRRGKSLVASCQKRVVVVKNRDAVGHVAFLS